MHISEAIKLVNTLVETGAGPARIWQHVQDGTPFIAISAFRSKDSHANNLKSHARLQHMLSGLPVSFITVDGEYQAVDSDRTLPELSFFVMPRGDTDVHRLRLIGQKLRERFVQESVLFGDGHKVFLIFANGTKYVGDRITFRPDIIAKLPGFSTLKDRKFSFADAGTVPGAATYRQSVHPKPLDRVRNLP